MSKFSIGDVIFRYTINKSLLVRKILKIDTGSYWLKVLSNSDTEIYDLANPQYWMETGFVDQHYSLKKSKKQQDFEKKLKKLVEE